jgi:hypothetical protein
MTLIDRLILLATGVTALYLIWRMWTRYQETRARQWIYAMIGFGVLFVAGVLLILFTYEALASPLVIIVAVLIPAGISTALVAGAYPRNEFPFLIFMVLGLLAIAVTRYTGPATLATIVLIIVHSVAGLTIFFLPILAVRRKLEGSGYLWVTVGGTLIGLGGIALAFLKTGRQLLFFSADFVFTILAPLLLLMTLAFTAGFVKVIQDARRKSSGASV